MRSCSIRACRLQSEPALELISLTVWLLATAQKPWEPMKKGPNVYGRLADDFPVGGLRESRPRA